NPWWHFDGLWKKEHYLLLHAVDKNHSQGSSYTNNFKEEALWALLCLVHRQETEVVESKCSPWECRGLVYLL
ncbi:hypothetical protein ACQP3C_28950, partial [Escherichia coli]